MKLRPCSRAEISGSGTALQLFLERRVLSDEHSNWNEIADADELEMQQICRRRRECLQQPISRLACLGDS
jgi:hypothetical protein